MKDKQTKNYAHSKPVIWFLVLFLLCASSVDLFAQGRRVTGVVKDETGETIIGASILEKGTANGVATDLDGAFSLPVSGPGRIVLIISYVGYVTQEVEVQGTQPLNIVLIPDSEVLDEVVVVGYGQQKKESVVGAISQVSSKELLKSPSANISQAIAGKLPGVITSQASGAPGADDMQIFIRGRATFASEAEPLVLVDGVERPFSQIAPDDVETISVLKDASATAVYGVRGANGVLLVTTKRGLDQKPVVNLTANWQYQTPTRGDTFLDSYQSVLLLEEALSNDGLPSQYNAAAIAKYKAAVDGTLPAAESILYPNVNWYDEVLNNYAPAQRYNLSVRGGTKRMRYYASGEYYDQEGLYKNLSTDPYGNKSNTSYRRFAFRANLDFLMTADLTASVNFGTRFEERNGPNAKEDEVFYELNHTPGWVFPVSYRVQEGEIIRTLYGGTSQYQNNIVARLAKAGHYRRTNTINETNFIVNYKMDWLTQGLSARAMVSFDYNSFYNRSFTAQFATYQLKEGQDPSLMSSYTQFGVDTQLGYAGNGAGDYSSTTYTLYMEAQLNYARKFGLHDVTGMMLYNQNDNRYQGDLPRRRQGLVGRVTYSYDDRYLAEFNAGFNGSENFMKGHRFGFFPAFSLGWRVTNESFMESYKQWLTNLKIRGSYGEVGNDAYTGQRFLFEERWTQKSNDYYFGQSGKTGIYEEQYPNYAVTWERARKFNVGAEFSLWNGLLAGEFDYFYERRNDILTTYASRPEWVGVTMAAGNLGETKNSGFELTLRHFKQINKDLSYNINATLTHAGNEILSMDEPTLKTAYRKQEGHPIKQYFGLVTEGFLTAADLANPKLPVSTFGTVSVGDLKYKDMNEDGFIDERDVTYIGYTDLPENTYTLALGVDYKRWSFSMMLQGIDHVSRYYDAEAQFAFVNGGKVKEHHLQRWNPAESEAWNLEHAKYPLLHYDNYGNHNQRLNSFFLKNGAFMRVKNAELSYRLPESLIKKVGMSSARLYVNGNNLFTFDHIDGLVDPESNGSNKYPIMRTFNFGVNIQF